MECKRTRSAYKNYQTIWGRYRDCTCTDRKNHLDVHRLPTIQSATQQLDQKPQCLRKMSRYTTSGHRSLQPSPQSLSRTEHGIEHKTFLKQAHTHRQYFGDHEPNLPGFCRGDFPVVPSTFSVSSRTGQPVSGQVGMPRRGTVGGNFEGWRSVDAGADRGGGQSRLEDRQTASPARHLSKV